ncbi:HNH endonuclease [Scytonema hofmannii FACHB-248]|uniref:HNH endonuclease n=1 Tax=Scytonema hofmannii FACHB-248 TaxID=1842502 RepID=A0ABR8GVY9_9CYAN|nr:MULTISPECIES: RNA-guided endonuclease IscB [Nostocales]MBD2607317.1 HNH endonuclease [Scytonema hofmannii FACHB-248]
MSNFVLVLDTNKRPLDPVHPGTARKILTDKKASVFRRHPFTIILKDAFPSIAVKPIKIKLDPGSKTTGIALVQEGKVIFGAELQHRGQAIKGELETRKAVRRSRRNRHTRYRKPRFLNRVRRSGWLAPSLEHRVKTTMTWVNKLIRFAPIAEIFQELVRFDLQQLENPEISGIEYQQGELQGYEVREYLLEKWSRKCAYCNVENVPLQIEHIKPRASSGTNRISNLCLACEKCNIKKGTQDVALFLAKKPEVLKRVLSQAKCPLKDAAAVNSTRWTLFNALKETRLPVIVASGGKTKFNRRKLELPKTHWIDAACVGDCLSLKILTAKPLLIKSTGKGTRRLCRVNKLGFPCSKPRTTYTHGWNTGDIALCKGVVGRVVVQSSTRLEVRVDGKRIGGKLSDFRKLHNKDSYSYA